MPASRLFGVTIGAAVAAALLAPIGFALKDGLQRPAAAMRRMLENGTRDPFFPPTGRTAYTPDSDHPFTTAAITPIDPGLSHLPAPTFESIMRGALADYAAGDLRGGDALSGEIGEPAARVALEWAALHAPTGIPFRRYSDFLSAHPDWPGADWARREAEEALWRDKGAPQEVLNFFAHQRPETAMGELALARALVATGAPAKAGALVRAAWRRDLLFPNLETELRSQFGAFLTADDDMRRAERLLYHGDLAAGLRAAGHAGAGELALARALAAAAERRAAPATLKAVPPALRNDPAYLYADISRLDELGDVAGAARAMLKAPHDAGALVDPDAWWLMRRRIARELLDHGNASTAYALCAGYVPGDPQTDLDAEFHAGWIALRFLHDARLAEPHFAKLAALARTPVSKSRGEYWLGRTFAALGAPAEAHLHFRAASTFPDTYYGQLADAALGNDAPSFRFNSGPAASGDPVVATRAVTLLDAFGAGSLAYTLAIETAHALEDPSQLAALADVGQALGDARLTATVGKIAARRGFDMTAKAFPTFGVPPYAPLARSAPLAIVYAVARQESSFRSDALSSAGAHGVMQMIVSTARQTAKRFNLPFTPQRLKDDPSFNAELGAAHLGQLLREERGSLILVFAAYNAGGRRVAEWIKAHGDPRRPGVDPVDWVERIPIAETRDYVERVMENYVVYKARFAHRVTAPEAAPPPSPELTPVETTPRPAPPASFPQARL